MLGKTFAGLLLGLSLAIGLTGLYGLIAWPSFAAALTAGVLAMVPLWVAIWTASYAFASGRRAWLWLGGANLLCYGSLWALKTTQLLQVPA